MQAMFEKAMLSAFCAIIAIKDGFNHHKPICFTQRVYSREVSKPPHALRDLALPQKPLLHAEGLQTLGANPKDVRRDFKM